MAKDIQGLYYVYGNITGAAYTLTGADRGAIFGITGAQTVITSKCVTNPDGTGKVCFNVERVINIKKIRLMPNGAPGLKAAPNYIAGEFELQAVGDDNGTIYTYDKTKIQVPEWGDWCDVDLKLEPYKRVSGNSDFEYVQLSVNPTGALFRVDDFNIQNDYIGQGVTPWIELMIDTAGVFDYSSGEEF